jgi:anion-transporting  ArsA/GET3 family ATPase
MPDFATLIATHRIIVCVGSGGVGKTTTAAALGLWGAMQGRRTAVLTIDPAKRLAACLGLSQLSEQATPLSPETFAAYGLSPRGSLTALLVDQQRTWDAVIKRYAPTPELCEQILANRFYQGLSRTFAGSHEYMAFDTLATLTYNQTYDLIVVDTPPTRQALDFLEAPQRLQRFLDSQLSKWLMRSAAATRWSPVSAVNRTVFFLLRKVEDTIGITALEDIREFFSTMQQMFIDFGHRLARVNKLLGSAETAFVLVTSPNEEMLIEAEGFRASLGRLGVSLKGVIVNGVLDEQPGILLWSKDATTLARHLDKVLHGRPKDRALLHQLAENFLAYQTLAQGEESRLASFCHALSEAVPVVRIPLLPIFPADLGGLVKLHQYLFGKTASPRVRRRPARSADPHFISETPTTPSSGGLVDQS